MRIAVISDTHDRFPPGLADRLRGADEIWHLGDVCAPEILGEIEELSIPLHVIKGNCDENAPWPLTLQLDREGVRFHLVHIPPVFNPPGIDALLHGHTHVVRDEMRDGVRWLNPGSASRPRTGDPTFAWLEVERGKLTSWQVLRV